MTIDSLQQRGRLQSTPEKTIYDIFKEDRSTSLTHAETTLPKYQHELNIDVILPRWMNREGKHVYYISSLIQRRHVRVLGRTIQLAGVELHFGKMKAQLQLKRQ